MWVSIDPSADYGKTVKAVKARRRRLPGLPPRGDDLHEEPDDRRAAARRRTRSRSGSSATTASTRCQKTAEDVQKAVAGTDGVVERAHRLAADRADDGGRGRPGRRPRQSGSSPATSVAPPRPCCRASGSATSSRTRRSSTWSCGARRTPARACPASRACSSTRPTAATSAWATWRPCGCGPPRRSSSTDDISRFVDVTANVKGHNVGKVADRVKDAAQGRQLPGRVPRRAAGRLLPRAGRAAAHARLRPRRGRSASSCSCRPRSRAGGWAPSPSRPWSSPSPAACFAAWLDGGPVTPGHHRRPARRARAHRAPERGPPRPVPPAADRGRHGARRSSW